jgi:hypothetical protein
MKKLLILIIIAISVTSCSSSYMTTSYNTQKSYTFKRGGVRYKIVDTYTRVIVTDTITKK